MNPRTTPFLISTIFTAICPAFFALNAAATSFYIRPFSEFTQNAPNIVRGTLSNIHAENAVMADGGRTIYTYATVEVKEVFKGGIRSGNITVRKVGGTKDGVTLEIPSSVEFENNDDTVLYLTEEREDHSYEVTGMELGKFGIKVENGKEILTGGIFDYANDESLDQDGGKNVIAGDIRENKRAWSLDDLRSLIQKQGAAPEHPHPKAETKVQGNDNNLTQRSSLNPQNPSSEDSNSTLNQANPDSKKHLESKDMESSFPWIPMVITILMLSIIFLFLRRR